MVENPRSKPSVKEDEAAEEPSVIGSLFVPQFGHSIRPIGQIGRVFVNLIAAIFAMNGLFPKNHPAFKGEGNVRLSLSGVLRTAWSGLEFTPDGLPKVLLFFAVAAGIVLIVLSFVTALALGLVSHAHAQTAASTSIFTSPAGSSDLATNWITYLFDQSSSNQSAALASIESTLSSTGAKVTMPTTTLQSAMASALAAYSDAILVIAAVILFYHLAAMVVETAHHGVPMGKRANQIWAPIRLVFAIGLLVPVSGGLNCGQLIVVQIAKWGSGMASTVWTTFANQMAKDASTMPALSPPGDYSGVAANMALMYGCEYAFNYNAWVADGGSGGITPSGSYINGWGPWTASGPPVVAISTSGAGTYNFGNMDVDGTKICGSVSVPAKPTVSSNLSALQGTADSIYSAVLSSFSTMNTNAALIGGKMQGIIAPSADYTAPAGTPVPTSADITNLGGGFNTSLQAALGKISTASLSAVMSQIATNASNEGWIAAGSWINTLVSAQAELSGIAAASMPSLTPPAIGTLNKKSGIGTSVEKAVWGAATGIGVSDQVHQDTAQDLNKFISDISGNGQATASTAAAAPTTSSAGINCSLMDPMSCVLAVVDYVASSHGLWNDQNSTAVSSGLALGVQFNGGNPIMEMAQYGQNSVQTALDMMNWGILITMLSGPGAAIVGGAVAVGSALAAIPTGGASLFAGAIAEGAITILATAGHVVSALFFFLGTIFFTIGSVLAYVIPLLPFMHFFFGVVTWIASLAEAIVAVPLIALAHLTPEGDGLPGQSAKGAYTMIFSIFLRPVMMIFGLVCALLILYVAAGLLNALYAYAVAGVAGKASSDSHLAVSRIMFTVMYVVILFSIANHAFALISRFPDQAMEWMGGKGMHGQKMGEPDHISRGVGLVSGYVGQQAAGQLQQMSKTAGDGMTRGFGEMAGGRKKMLDFQDKQKDKEREQNNQTAAKLGREGSALPENLMDDPEYFQSHAQGLSYRNSMMGDGSSGNNGGGGASSFGPGGRDGGPGGGNPGDDKPNVNTQTGSQNPRSEEALNKAQQMEGRVSRVEAATDEAQKTADDAQRSTDELSGKFDAGDKDS